MQKSSRYIWTGGVMAHPWVQTTGLLLSMCKELESSAADIAWVSLPQLGNTRIKYKGSLFQPGDFHTFITSSF